MINVEEHLAKAVTHFWQTRRRQQETQGTLTGRRDYGSRGAVTSGRHADGFCELISSIVQDAGLSDACVYNRARAKLPGFFRPTKEWDVVVLSGSDLVAVVEVKSQVGSFGNNFNNRVEEALGNATDFWTAFRKGSFQPTARPWLGYLFLLEERDTSTRGTKRIKLNPFPVDEEFQERSYAKRYELVCVRMVRELLYDGVCFITSKASEGLQGGFREPNPELSIRNFAISLHSRAAAFANMK